MATRSGLAAVLAALVLGGVGCVGPEPGRTTAGPVPAAPSDRSTSAAEGDVFRPASSYRGPPGADGASDNFVQQPLELTAGEYTALLSDEERRELQQRADERGTTDIISLLTPAERAELRQRLGPPTD